jgi:hypothetical protein
MPKPLKYPPPLSAVRRFLNQDGISRALTKVESGEEASAEPTELDSQSLRPVKREFVLTPETAQILDNLVDSLRRMTSTRVSGSHVLRALLLAAEPGVASIGSELEREQPWRLPANGARFAPERAAFERRLGAALIKALLPSRCT